MITHRVRVLCVDDNRDVADSEAMLLGMCGFDAQACYSGAGGASSLPRTSARTRVWWTSTCRAWTGARSRGSCGATSDLPPPLLIAVTAKSGADDYRRTAEAGFDEHLVKPVEPARLLALLAGLSPVGNAG